MSRYIDADELMEIFKILKWDASCSIVEDMPTADVVPMDFHNKVLEIEIKKQENLVDVVRCKDCKRYTKNCFCTYWQSVGAVAQLASFDYCSYGERREDAEIH